SSPPRRRRARGGPRRCRAASAPRPRADSPARCRGRRGRDPPRSRRSRRPRAVWRASRSRSPRRSRCGRRARRGSAGSGRGRRAVRRRCRSRRPAAARRRSRPAGPAGRGCAGRAQRLRRGRAGGEPFSLPAARAPGTRAPSSGAPADGGREGTGMRIQGEDLARVVVAGLAAAFLAGLLTVLWTAPEPLPQATLIGAVVVIGLITAAGYRHVGALAAVGAVLTLLGAAQLYSVSITPLAVLEEARRGGGSVDEMLQGPAHSLLLGCLLLGAACGWALRRVSTAPRLAQYGWGMVVVAVVSGVVAIWPMSGAT